jgi:DNA modification methylase
MNILKGTTVFFFLIIATLAYGQQAPDTAYNFAVADPRYPAGKGSVVTVDAAHNNFHTLDNRYGPFGKVLANDGYRMVSNDKPVTGAVLRESRIYVISNPLDSSNIGGWQLPTPSAFSPAEIAAINDWVKNGGRLLLIADHMPFAGAAQALAQSFGFKFLNCFAMDNRRRSLERFYRGNQSLSDDEITRGVDTVVTFTGSAFKIPKGAKPILTLKNYTLSLPVVAWQFEENTPAVSGDGFFQGAYMDYGKGKIVVMGEAAMFSAQLAGPNRNPVGLNRPEARANNQLLLNIIHWLDK